MNEKIKKGGIKIKVPEKAEGGLCASQTPLYNSMARLGYFSTVTVLETTVT